MSTDHHTPLANDANLDATTVNVPLGQLDQAINYIKDGKVWDTATTLTIASGVVTQTEGRHKIAAESGTTDDLVTITPLTNGQLLLLQADAGDTITLKHGTGNIYLGSFEDQSISGNKVILLYYDGSIWMNIGSPGASIPAASNVPYTPASLEDWGGSFSGNADDALDYLAARLNYNGYMKGYECNISTASLVTVLAGTCLDSTGVKRLERDAGQVNLASTGINGLDSGSKAASTTYYIYVCRGNSGTGFLASTSATSPTLPSGYDTYKRRIGICMTDTAGDLYNQITIAAGGATREIYYLEDCTTSPFEVATDVDCDTGTGTVIDMSAVVPSGVETIFYSGYRLAAGGALSWYLTTISSFQTPLASQVAAYTFTGRARIDTNQPRVISSAAGDEGLYLWLNGYSWTA